MFYVDIKNVTLKRFCKPLYANTQATPQAFTLAPTETKNIVPGTVLSLAGANADMVDTTNGTALTPSMYAGSSPYVQVCNGTMAPYGLSAHFASTEYSDEVRKDGTNGIGVWVGAADGMFQILAPAFDNSNPAAWVTAETNLSLGQEVFLCSSATGLITLATAETTATQKFLKLVDVVSPSEITVRFA